LLGAAVAAAVAAVGQLAAAQAVEILAILASLRKKLQHPAGHAPALKAFSIAAPP
jgi:hypothetical protein